MRRADGYSEPLNRKARRSSAERKLRKESQSGAIEQQIRTDFANDAVRYSRFSEANREITVAAIARATFHGPRGTPYAMKSRFLVQFHWYSTDQLKSTCRDQQRSFTLDSAS